MTTDSEITLRVTRDLALAQEWELVLVAQGLSPSVHQTSDGILLSVPEKELERALASLSAYERENPAKFAAPDESIASATPLAGILVAATLVVFFSVTVSWSPSVPWFERGAADADGILRGELWRTVTALTLHADIVHVLSNAIAAAVFLGAVYGVLGVGLGSVLVLLAGTGGNLANALLHGSSHVSVGASTAIFASVGLLGSFGMRRRRAPPRRRAWLPIAAALALLAILGTGGQRVDILAHLFGFLLGGVLGILFAFLSPDPPGLGVQWSCGCGALALLIYCWTLALG